LKFRLTKFSPFFNQAVCVKLFWWHQDIIFTYFYYGGLQRHTNRNKFRRVRSDQLTSMLQEPYRARCFF